MPRPRPRVSDQHAICQTEDAVDAAASHPWGAADGGSGLAPPAPAPGLPPCLVPLRQWETTQIDQARRAESHTLVDDEEAGALHHSGADVALLVRCTSRTTRDMASSTRAEGSESAGNGAIGSHVAAVVQSVRRQALIQGCGRQAPRSTLRVRLQQERTTSPSSTRPARRVGAQRSGRRAALE